MTESALLAAAAGGMGDRVPVWFMRQAGRSLPEYRALRERRAMLDACQDPELVTEITMQPVRRHGVDGAIFFSDIVVPLLAAGVDLDIVPGVGPVVAAPVREAADVERLQPLDPADIGFVTEAGHRLVAELGDTPLIGFAGAPFTLASYLIEGGPSKTYARTKALMLGQPALWHDLCRRLADISATFLQVQVAAGARMVQLFDSWAGALSPSDYREYVLPHSTRVLESVTEVPRIHFGVGTGELLSEMASITDVIGVDWRIDLAEASRRVGGRHPVQGNLDPAVLGAPWEVIADRVRAMIRSGASAPGHIANLGHGVPPDADPDVLTRIVELVHAEGAELRAEAKSSIAVDTAVADTAQ